MCKRKDRRCAWMWGGGPLQLTHWPVTPFQLMVPHANTNVLSGCCVCVGRGPLSTNTRARQHSVSPGLRRSIKSQAASGCADEPRDPTRGRVNQTTPPSAAMTGELLAANAPGPYTCEWRPLWDQLYECICIRYMVFSPRSKRGIVICRCDNQRKS